MAEASVGEVKAYFGYKSAAEFMKDWKLLSDEDRQQIKAGIGDESLNY